MTSSIVRGARGLGMGGHSQPNQGKTNSWITPQHILKALPFFDLDPCASTPQPWPCAYRSYTEADDGLTRNWSGRVFMNPPYGAQTAAWLERLADHGDGVALVFARTETRMFFSQVWERAGAILFLRDRLFFHYPDGTRAPHNSGAPSCLIAYGPRNIEALATAKLPGAILVHWRITTHAE